MPNAQGGPTAEEDAEMMERLLHQAAITNAGLNAFPDQTPSIEEQLQQGPKLVAAGLLNQNAGYQNQVALDQSARGSAPDQPGILDVMEPMVLGLGPPYAESPNPYSGPPPMEANADWDISGFPSNWHDYSSNNTTTGGGFFNMDELFHARGTAVPHAFQMGSNMPSTNNWRLLPPEYRNPRFIMRNGQIIDTQGWNMYGPSGSGGMGDSDLTNPRWRSGAGVGMPVAYSRSPNDNAISGWPGASSFQLHSMGGR